MHFDSMLEEKGGYILGEAPKHDMELIDVVIKVMTNSPPTHTGAGYSPPTHSQRAIPTSRAHF